MDVLMEVDGSKWYLLLSSTEAGRALYSTPKRPGSFPNFQWASNDCQNETSRVFKRWHLTSAVLWCLRLTFIYFSELQRVSIYFRRLPRDSPVFRQLSSTSARAPMQSLVSLLLLVSTPTTFWQINVTVKCTILPIDRTWWLTSFA